MNYAMLKRGAIAGLFTALLAVTGMSTLAYAQTDTVIDEMGNSQTASERVINVPQSLLDSSLCTQSSCTFEIDIQETGFYVATARLLNDNSEGFWGMSVLYDMTWMDSGFNSGTVLKENGEEPSFMAFYLSEDEAVRMTPFEYSGNVPNFNLKLSRQDLLTGNRQPVFGPLNTTSGTSHNTVELKQGFYVAEVSSNAGDARGRFGLSVTAHSMIGGVNTGGWIDNHTGSNGEGFSAFNVSYPQTVEISLLFGDTYGEAGSGYIQLDVYQVQTDGSRELYFTSAVNP